jgi:hypothetical protein
VYERERDLLHRSILFLSLGNSPLQKGNFKRRRMKMMKFEINFSFSRKRFFPRKKIKFEIDKDAKTI